jgi:hypothetical protein
MMLNLLVGGIGMELFLFTLRGILNLTIFECLSY